MDDVPTGQLVRQDSPAGSGGTEPAETDADGAGNAPQSGAAPEIGAPPEGGSRAGSNHTGGRRTGGRRYRTGHPPPERLRAYEQPRAQTTPFPSGLAGLAAWGTLAGLFACCLISCLLATWLHLIVVAGLGFCAGCAVAAWYCRPAALLRMVIAVPSVFLVAEIIVQLATLQRGGRRGLALPVAGGTLLTLAAVAPWLFAGTAGTVAIGLFRGLPQCVRELRAELRGRAPTRRAPRARHLPHEQRDEHPLRAPQAPRG